MVLKKIKIVFLFLISHVLSIYYIKKKHGSVKVRTKEGIVYLNADNFNKNIKFIFYFMYIIVLSIKKFIMNFQII